MRYGSVALVSVVLLAGAAVFVPSVVLTHNPITTTVRYNREVAPILERRCLQCHAPGGSSIPLTTYAETRPWAEAIKEEILTRRMPPWPADRGYGEFVNDGGLTAREMDFLLSWIDGGAPDGDDGVEPPAHQDHSAHWMLGTPGQIASASTPSITPPGRPAGWQRVVLETGLRSATWVRAFDYKPGNKAHVRAAFLSVEGTGEYLGAWTSWHTANELPQGVAIRLPAGARVVVDELYQGSLERQTESPQLGLYFADRPRAPLTSTTVRPSPGQRLRATFPVTKPTRIYALWPELPAGTESLEVRAIHPDGAIEVILWVRRIRQEWPTPFILREPLRLAPGAAVEARVAFADGSAPAPFALTLSTYPDSTR